MKSKNIRFAVFFVILVFALSISDASAQGFGGVVGPPPQEPGNQSTADGANQETTGTMIPVTPSDVESVKAVKELAEELVLNRLHTIIVRGTDTSFEQIAKESKANAAVAKRLDAAMKILAKYKDSFEKIFASPGRAGGIDMADFDQYLEAIGQKDASWQQMDNIHKELVENTLILFRAVKKEQTEDRTKVLRFISFATDDNIEIAERCYGKTPQEIRGIVESIQRRRNPPPPVASPEIVAPPLDRPEEWLKSLRDIASDEKFDAECDAWRYLQIMEYAVAAKDDTLYNETKKAFFSTLKSRIGSAGKRIDLILEALPEMIRRNNFDGLKDILIDTAILMPPNERNSDFHREYRTKIAACYLAMGDRESAQEYITSIMDSDSVSGKYDCSPIYTGIADSIAGKITKNDASEFRKPGWQGDLDSNRNRYRFCGYYLARNGLHKEARDFITKTVQSKSFTNYNEYSIAMAFAVLGDFDQARLRYDKYPKNKHWNDVLLAFIIRQEFLAGEFRGVEHMKIENLRRTYDGKNFTPDACREIGRSFKRAT